MAGPDSIDWLTPKAAAHLLGASLTAVYQWIRKGQLESRRLGGRILVSPESLGRFRDRRPGLSEPIPGQPEAARVPTYAYLVFPAYLVVENFPGVRHLEGYFSEDTERRAVLDALQNGFRWVRTDQINDTAFAVLERAG